LAWWELADLPVLPHVLPHPIDLSGPMTYIWFVCKVGSLLRWVFIASSVSSIVIIGRRLCAAWLVGELCYLVDCC